jgi:hypothetical protein
MNPTPNTLADLFKPLAPADSAGAQALPVLPVAPLEAQKPPVSGPGTSGQITPETLSAGLKHTEISSVTGSGVPGQPGTIPGAVPNPQASVSLGGMVQGEWAVNIVDALLPAAMVAGFYAMGLKLRKSELQLTEKEKGTIAPIMQKCLDSVLLNFNNPWNALAITMIAIYGGKLMEKGLVGWLDKKQEAKQAEVLKEKIEAAERQTNPAAFDHANQSAHDIQTGKVIVEGAEPFTEEDIRRRMKEGKEGREKAIRYLRRKFQKQVA